MVSTRLTLSAQPAYQYVNSLNKMFNIKNKASDCTYQFIRDEKMFLQSVYKETKIETVWENSAINHVTCLGLKVEW